MNFFLWLKPRNVVMIMEVLRELEAKAERGLEDCSGRVMPSLTTDWSEILFFPFQLSVVMKIAGV